MGYDEVSDRACCRETACQRWLGCVAVTLLVILLSRSGDLPAGALVDRLPDSAGEAAFSLFFFTSSTL